MMYAWSFSARTADEVCRLVRALSKHRYLHEVDLKLHFVVDRALAPMPEFAPHAAAFDARVAREPELELGSRDPSLWRKATLEEVLLVLTSFWTPDPSGLLARARLLDTMTSLQLGGDDHAPFASKPEEPPHPELVLLDWVLLPVEDLDAERHAGALAALEESGEELQPGALLYQEGAVIAASELVQGAPNGALVDDFVVWSEGPYPYADYVFRGASKAAKLVEPPVGYREL